MSKLIPCPYPLSEFYRLADQVPPLIYAIAPEEIPEPQSSLLWHQKDMTPTLEAYYQKKLALDVKQRIVQDGVLLREVALVTPEKKPVEFGAIHINLALFPDAAKTPDPGVRKTAGYHSGRFQYMAFGKTRTLFQSGAGSTYPK